MKDAEIAKTFHCHITTVENVRRRLLEHGLETVIERAKHKAYKPRKLDGRAEAQLVVIACSEIPAGRNKWTLRLLADKMVELNICHMLTSKRLNNSLF